MNELYAVDPGTCSSWRELKLLLDKFGLCMGRFVAEYPNDWRQMVLESFSDATELDRKRVVELISKACNSTMAVDLEFKRTLPWPDNAVRQQNVKRVFRKIISTIDAPPSIESIEGILFEVDRDLPDGRGAHVAMTVENYVSAIWPLLQFSSEIVLMDRFFRMRVGPHSPDEKHRAVLHAVVEAANASRKCKQITLVVDKSRVLEVGCSEEDWERDLEGVLDRANSGNVELLYKFPERMRHGRYIFSNLGGLQFDYGFDIESRGKSRGKSSLNHIHWLSLSELEPLIREHIEGF